MADALGRDADEQWVADALERRRTYYQGIAKRLGIKPQQAQSLAKPTVTITPSVITIVDGPKRP